jgi:hypothetical protein
MPLFGLTKDIGPFIYPRVSQMQIHGHTLKPENDIYPEAINLVIPCTIFWS